MASADQHLAVAQMRWVELQPKVASLRVSGDKKQLREAKRLVNETQREIRIMKKDLTLQERQIREHYKMKAARSSPKYFTQAKARDLKPLADAKLALDGALNQCDLLKVEIDRDIARVDAIAEASKAAAAAPAPGPAAVSPPPSPPAPLQAATTQPGWYPDPWGDGEHRWWDGTAWTTTVAIGGQQYTDRVPHW